MLSAVVTVMGEVAVPPIKPLREETGPENVVNAMIWSLHASGAYLSACRQPGLSDTPEGPECLQYTPTANLVNNKKGAEAPFFNPV
jgi:hypothetical protein